MRRIGGAVLAVTGVLACPCHLVVTLPLVTGLLAGTALGSLLARLTPLVYTGAGIYFVVALALGYWFWLGPNRPKRDVGAACSTCESIVSETREQAPEPSPVQADLPLPRR